MTIAGGRRHSRGRSSKLDLGLAGGDDAVATALAADREPGGAAVDEGHDAVGLAAVGEDPLGAGHGVVPVEALPQRAVHQERDVEHRKAVVVDIVVVATPHNVHTEYVVAAAEAGKHVLIEKPVAITLEDVRQQQAAVRKAGVKTVVSFVLHWNPLLMTIDRLINEGVFGTIFMVEVDYMHRIWLTTKEKWYASRKKSGTAILTGGCHAIDALRWFARSEAEQVSAYQVKTENPIEYPGTISVNVKFEDGKIGRSTTTFDAKMPYRFNIAVYEF